MDTPRVGLRLAMLALWLGPSCTDADLYRGGTEAGGPDRLTLEGRVCTDEPSEARFPTRVALLVDRAAIPLANWDVEQRRLWVDGVAELIDVGRSSPELSFAIVAVDGSPELLSGPDFTRDSVTLDNAAAQLRQLEPPEGVGQARDIRAGISLVKSLIEGDAAALSPGELARIQYLVILVTAGLPEPAIRDCVCADQLRFPDCCFDEDGCRAGGGILLDQPTCQRETLVDDVDALQAAIEAAGATSLRFHTFQLLADPDPARTQALHDLLTQMAFAGNGAFGDFATPANVNFLGLDLLASAGSLDVKGLVVSNVNALPTVSGIAVDSDGDGLADDVESSDCTDPTVADTDGDGLTDLVDRLLGFDPCVAEDASERPTCAGFGPFDDTDFDGLRDCEEALVGTEYTLVDSDGDVLPDRMEVVASTRFLEPDALLDDDGDGVPNGEEVRNHTDPGSSDAGRHLGEAYRYEIVNEGLQRILAAQQPSQITGVEIDDVSAGTTAGLGMLRVRVLPGPPEQWQLSWRDPLDNDFGPELDVSGDGQFTILSASAVDPTAPQDFSIDVTVDENLLPTPSAAPDPDAGIIETILVRSAERRCLRYQVRNVRLVATQAANFGDEGDNSVFVYFAESPRGRLEAPGLFRIVNIPVNFIPPSTRIPDDPIITIGDDEFVRAGF